MRKLLMRLGECIIPVSTVEAVASHDWVEPVIGEKVMQCHRCLHVICLDAPWNTEDAEYMAQVEGEEPAAIKCIPAVH